MKNYGVLPELAVSSVQVYLSLFEELGFSVQEVVPTATSPTWAELRLNETTLMLQEANEFRSEFPEISLSGGQSAAIVVRIDKRGIQELHDSLTVKFTVSPITETDYGTADFSIRAPDGHIVIVSGV